MECTQVLLSESFDANNDVSEKSPVATLLIEGEYHTIYNTENVIGRENSCDIVINNSVVSSRHAVIEAEDSDAHLIYDLGSTNKTKLGKMALKPHVRYHINDGDCVTFGNVSAQYNISRKYLTSPIKGNTTLNSCSIPETPEHLTATLELASCAKGNPKVDEGSALELSDTDLFGEKEADTDLYPKELQSNESKTSGDIYEMDTLSFDENIENSVKGTASVEHLNEISVIPDKDNVEAGGFDIVSGELVNDKENISKGLSIYDKPKEKNNFPWEDFPEIASLDGLGSSNPGNLGCPKSKISSSFLDMTNDDLKSGQHVPKNIGGVILSDLCNPDGTCSNIVDINNRIVPSTSKESELKLVDETGKGLCSEETSPDTKISDACDLQQNLENDSYIPLSQNIDMFEESPRKRTDECHEEEDVYEMLTQVSIENKEESNFSNSIYDIQTQVVLADCPESRIDKGNDSSFILPTSTKLSILEPATQPYNNDNKDDNNISLLKVNVIDETDNNCSFSESVYDAETQLCFQNINKESGFTDQKRFDENMDSLLLKHQNKNGESSKLVASAPQPIAEMLEHLQGKIDQNDTVSAIAEVATQPCPPANISTNTDQNGSLSTTIIEEATELCSVGAPCSLGKAQLSVEEIEYREKKLAEDVSVCDWFDIATQPCQTTSDNAIVVEKEIQKQELTENNEIFEKEVVQDSSFSISLYQTATQPCPKVVPEKTINELSSNLETALINDESIKNRSFSTSMCDIATQPCSKDIFPEKNEPIDETTSNSELTTMNDEDNKNIRFSTSICEIATQPCPKDSFPEKNEATNETISDHELTITNDENDKNNSFSTSIYEIATQPCPKDIFPEPNKTTNDNITIPELTTMNNYIDKNSSYSMSICEIATQPCPKDSFPEKIDKISSHEFTIDDESDKNSCFSTSIYEIATQPCPKDIFPETNEPIDETILNSKLTTMDDESNKNISFSSSMCEIATQPYPKDIFSDKTESINKNISNPELTIMNEDSFSACEIATQPCSLAVISNSREVTDHCKSIKNCENASNLIENYVRSSDQEMKFQQVKLPIDTETDSKNMLPRENTEVCSLSVGPADITPSIGEVTCAKSNANLEKAKNMELTHKPPDVVPLTVTLPNMLSDSFFEAATQPYKNDEDQDKTFPDPLTSICNNLSVDKIEEISDEFMFGNISAKLGDRNKTQLDNNSNKEYNELQKQLETSDSNIYEALAHQIPLRSQKNFLLDKVNPEKISTQDLQRILESDDLTQKYDDFKKTDAMPTVSDHVLSSDLDLLKNNVRSRKDNVQYSENNDISKDEKIINKEKNEAVVTISSDSGNKSQDVQYFVTDRQNTLNNDGEDVLKVETKKPELVPDPQILALQAVLIDSDSSQEMNIRSKKKRANVFPPDSQSFTDKFLDNEDSSQELNIRSNKKRCNVFPPDSQSITYKLLENEDSSQELNIKSNKKRACVFPPDSQDFTNKNLETDGNVSEKELVKAADKTSDLENATSFDLMNENIIKNDRVQKPSDDDFGSKVVSNTSVENHEQRDTQNELMNSNSLLDTTTNDETKTPKKKLNERTWTPGKRKSKESKNKVASEHERESSYISRGNITLHSPKVLSELEEQFRLTKVAMSPTQLSVVSDIDDEILSSQEVNEADKQGIRKSIRNRKNTSSKRNLKSNESPALHTIAKPNIRNLTEYPLNENEIKIKEISSFSGPSKSQKSFKKFQKVSPINNNTPNDKKLVNVTINEACADIVSNSSDNSQNSEELGRGKRKRTRTSYEGFIIEEEKKRPSRKKLSFSNSEDSENVNDTTPHAEEVNNSSFDELPSDKNNDAPDKSMNQTVSVVLYDIKKVSTDVIEPKIKKNKTTAKKTVSTSNKTVTSHVLVDKTSNLSSCSTKNEAKAKQNETSIRDKNSSYSFSEKLDELFNIWGPADRVKLSPRVAKKSYKLLAGGKTESANSSTSGKSVHTVNSSNKESKTSTSKSNKNSIKTSEKKNEPTSVVGESSVMTTRKRNLSQKNEAIELPDVSKQNKKRKKTNSETSSESVTNDLDTEVRKSSRINRKKTLNIPVPDNKPENNPRQAKTSDEIPKRTSSRSIERFEDGASVSNNPRQAKKTSDEMPKRTSNRSIESIEDGASVSDKNIKARSKNSNNTSMKPPLSTVVVNVKNKNLKAKEKKSAIPVMEKPIPEISEESYCFSQEYSFHESKIEKGRKKPSDDCSSQPLKIRRSGRKKTEKNAEKNVENVMFTGYADKKTKSLVNALGGQIVESPFTCTVLVTDKIRRTTKFLSALSRGLPIVSPQWLIDSNENGRFLDSNDFLLSDKEAENMFSFNLKKSIEKAQNGKVLEGWAIFVTPSVKPSPEEMKSIIECSGGRFLPKELVRWPTNSLIVSCDEDRGIWSKFSKKVKAPIIVDSEAILLGVLRQALDFESHKLL